MGEHKVPVARSRRVPILDDLGTHGEWGSSHLLLYGVFRNVCLFNFWFFRIYYDIYKTVLAL